MYTYRIKALTYNDGTIKYTPQYHSVLVDAWFDFGDIDKYSTLENCQKIIDECIYFNKKNTPIKEEIINYP